MKKRKLLTEDPYDSYACIVRVTYDDVEYNASTTADAIRSVEKVTIVRILDSTERRLNRVTMSVKLRTLGNPLDSFKRFRSDALKLQGIKKVELAIKTIEKKG